MIRICYMVDASYVGGAERYIEMLSTSLDGDLFDVSVVMKRADGTARWAESLSRSGLRVRRLRMNLPFEPSCAIGITRAVADISPHIAHVNVPGPYDGQMGLLLPIARASGAYRAVVTEHLPMVGKSSKRSVVKRLCYRWLDGAFTVCKANVEYLVHRQNVPQERVRVVYNGLPIHYGIRVRHRREEVRVSLGLDPNTTAVVIVGSLIERKGHRSLFRALSGLDEGMWHLFVVGEGELRAECERLVEDLGIGGRVTMMGAREPEEVEELLSAMDISALPSTMEGLPYALLEAMASGIAVVASDVYGVGEAVRSGETALLFPPGDEIALREALRTLLVDSSLRSSLGRAGRKRFEESFTLERHVAEMERHYVALAGLNGGERKQ